MVEFLFDSGPVRFWTGVGDLDYGGNEFTGSGHLLSLTEITETQEIEAQGVAFQLAGADDQTLSLALTEKYQNRRCTLYLGALDENMQLDGAPYELYSGRMDVMEINDAPDSCNITLTTENELIELKKAKVFRYTPEDQRRRYPDDYGLDFVPRTTEMEIIWGRKSA